MDNKYFKRGQWIFLDPDRFPNYLSNPKTVFCARESFSCAFFQKRIFTESQVNASLKISADVFYIIYLNGQRLAKGPAETGGDYGRSDSLPWRFFDTFEIQIPAGTTEIEILVALCPVVMADYSDGHGGLICEAETADGRILFCSDESWDSGIDHSFCGICIRDFNLPRSVAYPAVFSPRKEPIPSDLPPLTSEKILPVSCSERNNCLCFDFDKIYSAYIRLIIVTENKTTLKLRPQEIENYDNYGETVITKPGKTIFESLQLHSVRRLVIECSGPAQITAELIFTHFPVSSECSFNCDDPYYNELYETSRRTLLLCMQKYHLDSPVHQEALGCTGDYYIQSQINFYTFGETKLTRLDLLRTAWLLENTEGKMFHTSYSLLWIMWLTEYYHFSGDPSIFKECEKGLDALLSLFDSYCVDGLIENPPNYMFLDWQAFDEYNLHHPPKNLGQSALNCFYYEALQKAAFIKRKLGNTQSARRLLLQAKRLKKRFNEEFYDRKKKLYHGGKNDFLHVNEFLPKSNGKKYFTVHTNALSVLFGLADHGKKQIMKQVMESKYLDLAQPYFLFFIAKALCKANLFKKYYRPLLEKWKQPLAECNSAWKEVFNGFSCDYSHAWSGAPGYILPAKILGISFREGKCIPVKPFLGHLNCARALLPKPGGGCLYVCVKKKALGFLHRTIADQPESKP